MNQYIDKHYLNREAHSVPLMIEIEPTDTCNLRCKMCHVTYRHSEVRNSLPLSLLEKLDGLNGAYVAIGSGFEPTVYRHFVPLLGKLSRMNCGIEIITNAVLLKEDKLKALYDSDLKILNISFDGAKKKTYEAIRKGASYEYVLENIAKAKDRFRNRDAYFAINFTAIRSNLNEIPDAVDLWDNLGMDQLRILGLIVREKQEQVLLESIYPVLSEFYSNLQEAVARVVGHSKKLSLSSPHFLGMDSLAVFNGQLSGNSVSSGNPLTRVVPRNRQKIQTTVDDGGNVKCVSPFTFARILFNGDVQLCYQFSVGNLHSESFEKIWNGSKAQLIRKMVSDEDSYCKKCDYFKYCLKSDRIDYDKVENHFSSEILDVIEFRERGEIAFREDISNQGVPRLVSSVGEINIVAYRGEYWVVPQVLGDMDLSSFDVRSLDGVSVVQDFRQAQTIAKSIAARRQK
jgi:radical SAM protein with 4Fe4S-binding SPASM domain